jgi:hypothetical protein
MELVASRCFGDGRFRPVPTKRSPRPSLTLVLVEPTWLIMQRALTILGLVVVAAGLARTAVTSKSLSS